MYARIPQCTYYLLTYLLTKVLSYSLLYQVHNDGVHNTYELQYCDYKILGWPLAYNYHILYVLYGNDDGMKNLLNRVR